MQQLSRQSLADRLAQQIRRAIQRGDYRLGDRLPPITEMARRFGVGHPSVREALKKLETMGVVEIRHGSGVYVTRSDDVLLVASPDFAGPADRKLLLDLICARISIEVGAVGVAATNASDDDLVRMRAMLDAAGALFHDDERLSSANMGFHREIARASGNVVFAQLLDALCKLFQREQRAIMAIYRSREKDHEEHLGLLDALQRRDPVLAAERMKAHLEGVRQAVEKWDGLGLANS